MSGRDPALRAALGDRRTRRLWVWCGVMGAVGIACLQLPLFNVLGYELALVTTVVGSLAGLDLGIGAARRASRVEAPVLMRARDPGPLVAGVAARAAAVAAAISAIPAVLAAINGLFVPTCDWTFGIRTYLSMTTASAALFAGAGVAIGLATARGRGWVAALAGIGIVLALAGAALWRFYSEPPVYTYTPLLGYFPGNLYDEQLALGAPLYWARLEQLGWVIAMLAAVAAMLDAPSLRLRVRERRPAGLRPRSLAVAGGAAAVALVLHLMAGRLGYAVDREDVLAELSGVVVTEHFAVHYPPDSDVAEDIAAIAEDHEFRLHQIAQTLGLTEEDLRRLGRIHSYYFTSPEQKSRLIGAKNVEMAKPWRREIYLTRSGFPVGSLRHEIAHVVAGLYGDPWFGVASRRVAGVPLLVNPGLIEGFAVAVDWPGNYGRSLTPHQAVRVMQAIGTQPSVARLMSIGFLSFSSQNSYMTAGSFLRFLLETRGVAPLRALYRNGGDFERAYGESLTDLEAQWREMLATVPVDPQVIELGKERFRHGSLFARPCPHAVAARRAAADRAFGRGDRAGAIARWRKVCEDSQDEPRDLLAPAGVLALGDSAAEHDEAVTILDGLVGDVEAVTSTVRASALRRLATIAARDGDRAAADAHLAAAAALPLDDDAARQIEAPLFALRHPGPAAPALNDYFFSDVSAAGPDPTATAAEPLEAASRAIELEPGLGMGWYLRGLQRALRKDHLLAVADLRVAVGLGLPSPRFVRNAARLLAVGGWRAGDRAAVEEGAALLAASDSEMDRLLAADWRERLAWSAAR